MARQSMTFRTVSGTNASAALEIIAAVQRGFKLIELGISLAAATASTYSLGRPAAKGATPTTPLSFLIDGGGDAGESQARFAGAWGTPPTVPARFIRQVTFPATIGSERIWKFEGGIYVPANASIVLWNSATNGVVDVSAIIEE